MRRDREGRPTPIASASMSTPRGRPPSSERPPARAGPDHVVILAGVPARNDTRPRGHFFLAQTPSKTFGSITGPELAAQSDDNRYRREWVPVGEVAELALLPAAAKDVVVEAIESAGWPSRSREPARQNAGSGP